MTVVLVKQAIRVFLQTRTPQVLCIRGKWGVGKTFIWNEVLRRAIVEGGVALPYYSYLSLFSLQTVDEVRQAVFENSVPTTAPDIRPSLDSLGENIKRYTLAAGRQISKIIPYAKLPYVDKYVSNLSGGFRQIVSLAVRETIICFDDFERKKIGTKDLLGLISQFRDQRACKAVIILNEDALSDDERSEFNRYFEKVVDIPIEFSPTPNDCADIAITENDFVGQKIRESSVKLGISNIRIIHRIKDTAQLLVKIIENFSEEIKRQALHTLTLLIWSKYDDGAIPMSIIMNIDGRVRELMEIDNRPEDEKKWDIKLKEYDFGELDEFDLAIKVGVERGFFDAADITKGAQQKHLHREAAEARESLGQAWRVLHDSFDSNGASEVINSVHNAYKA
jgi:hypothetical protein